MATENGGDFAERREDLLQGIERDEEVLLEAVHELADVAEQKLDLREYIRSSPVAWLAGAFCFGLWLGLGDGDDDKEEKPALGPLLTARPEFRALRRLR
ncbi:MAG TPA: hypothetical protein VEC57_12355 [Candidatus Limnocylindrales bacterium]|nr:hypothetical protein [Candidatus Limnocylindrales bacterium]